MVNKHAIGVRVLCDSGVSLGQWSADANLSVADRTDQQAQPKIVPTDDGGSYISWFDNSTGGFDVYLQRLDAKGVEQWTHNGVLVADRGFSSTQDYGLSVAANGCALLTFHAAPGIAGATDGSAIVAWTNDSDIIVQNSMAPARHSGVEA